MEDEGTAKQKSSTDSPVLTPVPNKRLETSGSAGTFSSKRFSSIFESWMASSSSNPTQEDSSEHKRPIVSEPIVLDKQDISQSDDDGEPSIDEEFEQMIVSCFFFAFRWNLINFVIIERPWTQGRKTRCDAKSPLG